MLFKFSSPRAGGEGYLAIARTWARDPSVASLLSVPPRTGAVPIASPSAVDSEFIQQLGSVRAYFLCAQILQGHIIFLTLELPNGSVAAADMP